jgi:hypothetical protein
MDPYLLVLLDPDSVDEIRLSLDPVVEITLSFIEKYQG